MRISFTDFEINTWLEAIDNHFLTDSVEAIEAYEMIRKKFRNAQSRSKASKSKIRFIQHAERKKSQDERLKTQEEILKHFREVE